MDVLGLKKDIKDEESAQVKAYQSETNLEA